MIGKLPRLLSEKRAALGAWVTIGNPEVPEMLSLLGFDWLLFDMEHAPLDFQLLEYMLIAVKNDATPLVRVPFNDPVYVKRVLDLGVAGILFPLVNKSEDAKLAVASTKYPPRGIRGVGPRRAASYGLRTNEYFEEAGKVLVVVQIETQEAVKNIEEILSTDGVDAFFIGPNDLSFSFGYRSWKEEAVRRAIERVADASRSLGVPGGMYCSDDESLEFALSLGFSLIALGSDYRFLVAGAKSRLEKAKKLLAQG
ncbi:HpcH/HpaI aldolase family protein [Thermofilum pendens]|uniref:2-dehydro-3-deoxyglucarate aldolase n=1 Tax=Thermofilum pendens (strain DSM 2475 / Hrk 5) TaxID=368408 RepID=A1S0N9_THEPD|nr:aldolase/citrate lyase family protein [Thermofilum pendens]ABL79019.1 2-dehydro-3-deoxyglucarate aldolase [Thermofilum pendens Hrk 5]